jgi:RNase P subunit RPR2
MVKMKKMLTYMTDNGKVNKIIEIANIVTCDSCGNEMRFTVTSPSTCHKCFATIVADDFIFSNKKSRLEYHDNYGFGCGESFPGYYYL